MMSFATQINFFRQIYVPFRRDTDRVGHSLAEIAELPYAIQVVIRFLGSYKAQRNLHRRVHNLGPLPDVWDMK